MGNAERIWSYLISKGLSTHGAAGLMGNLHAESGLNPINLQNTYNRSLAMTDEEYTAAVDNGSYTNFIQDKAGYGLAQWTFWSRKQLLLNFAKEAGASIGDLTMQLDFLVKELTTNYSGVWATLKSATSVLEASNAVLLKFERPADQSEAVQTKRAAFGQSYYEKFVSEGGSNVAKKILIDPGHYTGVNRSPVVPSYYEGNQMWKLSQYLIPELKAYGFEVGCTKSSMADYPKASDGSDSVTTRGKKGKGYDFVLSLHSNAASDTSVERVVSIVFVDDNCGKIDDISYNLGKKLGEVVKETMGRSSLQMMQKKSSKDRDGDGKVNDDYYGFLFGAHQVGVPAVLMEHGFHTHAATAQWLLSDANLKKLAAAEAKVIAEWFGMSKSKTGWHKDKFGWWYVHKDGTYTKDGFEQIDGVWYYFDCDGYMLADQEVEYNGKIYKFDSNGHCSVVEKEETEVRYNKLKDITSEHYRPTIDKLIRKGLLAGKSGEGEEMVIDLSEDTVRTLVILDRAGVFGE